MVGASLHPRGPEWNPWGRNTLVFAWQEPTIETIFTGIAAIARGNPLRPAKLLKRKDRNLAERVGFVPTILAPINDLGPIRSP